MANSVHHHDHDHVFSTAADLRELLDRLTSLENAAAEFGGHNELACHSIGEATDEILEMAMRVDSCVVRQLGAIGMILPEIVLVEDDDERWQLMNSALSGVLQALEHVEELVAGSSH